MPRYVANQPIRVGWALAFNTGDQVPEENVLAHGYLTDGLVDLIPDEQPAVTPAAVTDDAPTARKSKGE